MKTRLLLISFFVIIYSNISVTAKAQAVNVTDSLALVDLYNSTDGPHWLTNWNWLKKPVRTWFGITVTGTRVTGINLEGNHLKGPLPSSIGNLELLSILEMTNNQITGVLPSSIGNLTSLLTLRILSNLLTGEIPASIGKITSLQYLNIAANQFTGTIPPVIGDLTNLTDLYLSDNQLTGPVPSSFGKLVKLSTLVLRNNKLTGNIPIVLCDLPILVNLYLDRNKLIGEVPAALVRLKHIQILDISHNRLTFSPNIESTIPVRMDIGMKVSYNGFTFDGIEVLCQKIKLLYTPQVRIPIHQRGNTLSVYAGGTLSNNTYTWFKAGDANSKVIVGDSTYVPAESGMYYAKITNAIATELTLHTDTITYTAPLAKSTTPLIVSIYPNPVRDILNINGLDGNSICNITVTDASGHVWLNGTAKNQSIIKYEVSRLKAGYYILHVSNGTTVSQVKFMKE